MFNAKAALLRGKAFAKEFDLQAPILLAPMAGATPPSLSIAVATGGGMGACKVLMLTPDQIASWVHKMRPGQMAPFNSIHGYQTQTQSGTASMRPKSVNF